MGAGWDGMHGIAAEEISNKIIFSGCVDKSIIVVFKKKTPSTNTFRFEGIKTEIFVVRMNNDLETDKDITKAFNRYMTNLIYISVGQKMII